MHFELSSAKGQPFYPGLIVLTHWAQKKMADVFQINFKSIKSKLKCNVFNDTFCLIVMHNKILNEK